LFLCFCWLLTPELQNYFNFIASSFNSQQRQLIFLKSTNKPFRVASCWSLMGPGRMPEPFAGSRKLSGQVCVNSSVLRSGLGGQFQLNHGDQTWEGAFPRKSRWGHPKERDWMWAEKAFK
jgi:hypothetical protein